MWNAVLIPHTAIDSVVTTVFLFQIAMLAVSMSTLNLIIIKGNCSKDIHAKDNQQRSSGRRDVEKSLKER
jgi:hypothetical protein